jgi:transposase InsO family protein
VTYLKNRYEVSERRACQVMCLHRSSYRYDGARALVDEAHRLVVKLSDRYPWWGYRKIHALIEVPVGRERVRLIRRREGLQAGRKRRKRRLLGASTRWVNRAAHPNHVWGYDFVHDQTTDGRSLKFLTIVDEFSREGLMAHGARSITAIDVIRCLEALIRVHGRPGCLRSDNGPEFVATAVRQWLQDNGIGTHYIDPGSPWQNPFSESFNSVFRTTCLDLWAFETQAQARLVSSNWLDEYNNIRPHGSLGGRSPAQFLKDWANDRRETVSTQRGIPNLDAGPGTLG